MENYKRLLRYVKPYWRTALNRYDLYGDLFCDCWRFSVFNEASD